VYNAKHYIVYNSYIILPNGVKLYNGKDTDDIKVTEEYNVLGSNIITFIESEDIGYSIVQNINQGDNITIKENNVEILNINIKHTNLYRILMFREDDCDSDLNKPVVQRNIRYVNKISITVI